MVRAGIDTPVIALWLGHEQIETTQIYLHADLDIKRRRGGNCSWRRWVRWCRGVVFWR